MNDDGNKPAPERAADGVWRVTRWPCRGPCWNGYWTVSRELPPGVWENVLNDAGKIKRFRSEEAAETEAGKRNGTLDRAARMLKRCRLPAEVPW